MTSKLEAQKTRTILDKKNRKWLTDQGWEANGSKGPHERWRRRSFDQMNKWMTFNEAVKRQTEWNRFWIKKGDQ